MQDKNSDKRFIISLFISILIHLLIGIIIYGLNKLTYTQKPQLAKIDASNLLILKRGRSQDPSKQKPGAQPPSLAASGKLKPVSPTPPTPPMPASRPTPTPPNPNKPKQNDQKEKQSKIKQQKKQENSTSKALDKYQKDYIDPKNLSLLSKEQSLAFQSSSSSQSANTSEDNNKGMDTQTKKEIDELYGEEFGDLGEAEKDFIKNNLREIGRITQKYLEYPRTAAYLGQDGENAVEFYLHPNGDITDLKILKKSGYVILDQNTLKTIEIAYKDYPRPSVKTLIRIHVRYFMYR
ncbi:siderophore-mediated iron transporter [Helicobacter sp. 12S02232-10]|uniref:energy transducer TonB n=1 Tax=Helicobacter sp. 12S02232-10 TaxID=1476197 RepID=UPI000BA7286F|nr:energy transducer TonB [Helicobacter sp. 12S02232-10]PAF48891.1 siderophore-mediated iron transporter [Helicobacter sp. 12S02232-10]